MPKPIRLLFIAIQFLTRLPTPHNLIATEDEIGRAAACFPLVGVIVGGSGALLHLILIKLLPPSACVLLVLIYAAFITNGFHEDGLADTFDGFGGGWTRERILEIMKDSRIGTFGALALIFLVLAKYNFLSTLDPPRVWRWLIIAHTAARWAILPLCLWLPYARAEGQGKIVARRIGWSSLIFATLTLIVTLALFPLPIGAIILTVTIAVVAVSGWYYQRKIQGITGDCLGATNQLTEVAIYLAAMAVANHK